jgi:hypothetical protein
MNNKLKTLGLASVLAIGSAAPSGAEALLTGQEKIQALISSIEVIQSRLSNGEALSVGAVGYASIGGVVPDGVMDDAEITQVMLDNYLAAKEAVLAHDYETAQTAQQMFTQEHAAAMVNLDHAVDNLVDATSVLMTATSVAETAAEADTSPEQTALQDMLATDEFSIDSTEVDAYNEAAAAVEDYAQQAGAFMAAANNTELTASIDTYASQSNFVVGSYTAITYTQSVDEFVITWADAGFNSGWQGYLSDDTKTIQEVYDAGDYITQYGSLPTAQ